MKHTIFSLFCLFLLFFPFQFSGALEIELNGGVNFMTYHPDRETAHSDSDHYKKFQDYPFGFGNLSVRGELSESMAFNVTAARDNILLNSLSFTLNNRTDNFHFEFGPFIAIGDRLETPNTGIIGSIEITFPGIAFLIFGGSSTLGSSFDFTSGSVRETAEVKFGLMLPFIIPSVSASTRSLTWQKQVEEANLTLCDTLTRFQVSAEFFGKNVPIIFRLDAGYEIYTRNYKMGNGESTDELNAWYSGFELIVQVSKPLRITAGMEIPIIYSAVEPMIAPDFLWNIIKANAGLVFTFF